MLSGKRSGRVPVIAPREVYTPPSPPESTLPNATKLDVPPPRIRLPPRSRTGCWTCRSRKVKCDENRPNCGQCARLGHLCDYSPRLSFRDDTPRVMERMSEVSTAGNAVWDTSIRLHSPPVSPGLYDSMPPFFTLTSDEEREKKAENSHPGTYHVVVVPDSFSNLPEYSEEYPIDLNSKSLKVRRGSATSSLLSPRDDRESSIETNDPNVVILDRFEDSSQRYSVSQWKNNRLSPTSSVVTSPPTATSPLHFPFDSHFVHHQVPGVEHGSRDEQLLVHFRNVVWKQLIQGQFTQELFSPLSSPISPISPGADMFEDIASTFQPLLHAMMAVSALSLTHQQGSQSLDALQHYQQTFSSLQTALHSSEDLYSDGLFLTHFLLLIYEIAAAEEGGSNLWSHHISQLLQISILRVTTFGAERYPYIIWLVCNIDLYALLSGAGTGDFIRAMCKNNMLPNPKCQLYPLAANGYSIIYPEENDTLPRALQLYHDTFVLATRLGFLAADIRGDEVHCDRSLGSNSPTGENTKWLYEIRSHLQQLWSSPDAHYLCQHMESLPQRSREIFQNAMTLYHSCMIYSYTSMWRGQRLGPASASEKIIKDHASAILQAAETIVRTDRFDLRFVIFPLFMAGVSTSSAGQKMIAIDIVSSMEKQGVGRNATTTRELLQIVYQRQTEDLMTIGHSANVEWMDVMAQHGLQVVNFGM
ncbi:hypothetical protein BGW36DRAFT_300923 [Talaromyces proteolyticus]|uniref:Zn(2)-C6 fungal-type domain-containing protein n=1 Tax=Talaromyces proteolyticus TaxID=1131652 RepID=A0AAD4PVH7_9EURO|nr:uncharacterized protein BGW36DRAFT_300923 [Talaromyces proteolyticus]KAH8693532.1 hypothetical protein BGW36DRAFT_300923 [Talaromyces proteolyticus]